jgi:hypothetical protein
VFTARYGLLPYFFSSPLFIPSVQYRLQVHVCRQHKMTVYHLTCEAIFQWIPSDNIDPRSIYENLVGKPVGLKRFNLLGTGSTSRMDVSSFGSVNSLALQLVLNSQRTQTSDMRLAWAAVSVTFLPFNVAKTAPSLYNEDYISSFKG